MSLLYIEPLGGSVFHSKTDNGEPTFEEPPYMVWVNTDEITSIIAFNVAANAAEQTVDDEPELQYVVRTKQGDVIKTSTNIPEATKNVTLNFEMF